MSDPDKFALTKSQESRMRMGERRVCIRSVDSAACHGTVVMARNGASLNCGRCGAVLWLETARVAKSDFVDERDLDYTREYS